MGDEHTLRHEVKTPLGTFAPGMKVLAFGARKFGRVTVCLDPAGYHPNGRCHKATVPQSWLSSVAPWRPNPRLCS